MENYEILEKEKNERESSEFKTRKLFLKFDSKSMSY